MLVLAVVAGVLLVALLYAVERIRRNAAASRRRRVAEKRLHAVIRDTDKRLEVEQAKQEHAAALTSVVPAIQKPGTRHVA